MSIFNVSKWFQMCKFENQWSAVVLKAASAPPGYLLNMQILRPYLTSTETLGMGPSNLCLSKPSRWLRCVLSLTATDLQKGGCPLVLNFLVNLPTHAETKFKDENYRYIGIPHSKPIDPLGVMCKNIFFPFLYFLLKSFHYLGLAKLKVKI